MKALLAATLAVFPTIAFSQERVESGVWRFDTHPRTGECVMDVTRELHGRNYAFGIKDGGWGTERVLYLWNGEVGPEAQGVDLVIGDRSFKLDFFKGSESEMANASFEQTDPEQQFMEALAAGSKMLVVENGQEIAEFSLAGTREVMNVFNVCVASNSEGHPEG